jgi:hypothetical protein
LKFFTYNNSNKDSFERGVTMKKCSRCKTDKPISEFRKNSRSKDGLSVWCKDCEKEYDREYRAKHKEEISKKGKLRYAKNRDKVLGKQKQRYHDNKDKFKEYRDKNKERIATYQTEYRETHREELREYHRQYYRERAESIRSELRGERLRIHELKTPCVKCGEDRAYSIDFHHINPSEKECEVSQLRSMKSEKVKNELKKCVCLCRNCHAEYHWIYGCNPESPVESLEEYLGKNPYDFTVDISQNK